MLVKGFEARFDTNRRVSKGRALMRVLDRRNNQQRDEFLINLLERVNIALDEISRLPVELREVRDFPSLGRSGDERKCCGAHVSH